jgi:hypothetical protein
LTARSSLYANSMMDNLRLDHNALPSPSMYWDYYVIFKEKKLCLLFLFAIVYGVFIGHGFSSHVGHVMHMYLLNFIILHSCISMMFGPYISKLEREWILCEYIYFSWCTLSINSWSKCVTCEIEICISIIM